MSPRIDAIERIMRSINCPYCQSQRIHRSKPKGVLESGLLAMIFVRPFRCEKCDSRFFSSMRWRARQDSNLRHSADVQQAVTSGIGGEMVTENIEGRERYPVNVRYSRDFRDNVDELRRVLIGTTSGAQIPVSDVAKISFSRGPSMIRDEDGALTGYVYIDLNTK